jgi:hypothetical protein
LASPIWRYIRFPHRATTLLPTPHMVVRWCSSTATPGSQYSRFERKVKPLSRCGINVLLPTEKADLRMIRHPSGDHIRIVSSVVQKYVAWSCRWIRDEIIARVYNT